MKHFDIEDVQQSIADDIAFDVQEALRKERVEIARILRREAEEHVEAALAMRRDHDDADDEAWMHDAEADILHRYADLILARTPAVPDPAGFGSEIAF